MTSSLSNTNVCESFPPLGLGEFAHFVLRFILPPGFINNFCWGSGVSMKASDPSHTPLSLGALGVLGICWEVDRHL